MEGFFALCDVNGCTLDIHNLEAKESFLIGSNTATGSTIFSLFKYVISYKLFYVITYIIHFFMSFKRVCLPLSEVYRLMFLNASQFGQVEKSHVCNIVYKVSIARSNIL